ncbi:MAG: aminotransferase class I/II-fold pyridoxal phosphate-dependent enzyme [Clostridiales bacterium]|nr:aminotransferase class I/II-fold pyridoxal phosphate-dependent enzyme [Clostridiales bacterium]
MKNHFLDALWQYSQSDIYPMHMPGHKRNPACVMDNPYQIDMTEVPGVDDLHHPEGIIKELLEDVAQWYGSKKSYLLVNGSTCGILSGITACCHTGDTILVARNCHKSVYNAIKLLSLKPIYVYPERLKGTMGELGIAGEVTAENVREALREHPEVHCVIVTSPTYEGMVSPIQSIAELCHEKGIPLIVDEAHGAHFNWSKEFPPTAVQQGADIVIESLHKTLPSFTQTAVLHYQGELVDEERLTWALQTYQSSSPSYILMAGMAQCFSAVEKAGKEGFARYVENLQMFREKMRVLKHLELITHPQMELSKIVISTAKTPWNGQQLEDNLLEKFRIQLEMSCGDYAIAMTSFCDERRHFDRLAEALLSLDAKLSIVPKEKKRVFSYDIKPPKRRYYSYEVERMPKVYRRLSEAAGCVSARDVYLYPPGIPFVTAGEEFSEEIVEVLQSGIALGYEVQGVEDGKVAIVDLDSKRLEE